MKSCVPFLLALALLTACVSPVIAVTTYVGASPEMSAVVSGTNEFSPGEDAKITVVVRNSGTADMKNAWVGGNSAVTTVTTRPDLSKDNYDNNYQVWQGSGTIARDDVPMTAKMVIVGLSPGNAPVVIKTDPQNLGTIATQGTKTVTFSAKITGDATEGEYQLPLNITYTYLLDATQPAADILQNQYSTVSKTVPLTIRIKPEVKIDVVEVTADNLSVGTGGYITLKIRNLGVEDGKKATVKLLRNGNSPIIPTDTSVFVGDFPREGVVTCRFKVGISTEAEKQSYPVNVAVTYENREGEIVTSEEDTIGIPVGGKTTFSISPEMASVEPGSDKVLIIRYTNTGDMPVYSAQARISAVDPFTSEDSTAYLGDMKPGESAIARYSVSVASDAAAKVYNLDTEVRYRDALDNSQVSDVFKVPVTVTPAPASSAVMQVLPVLLLIVLIAGAGYYLLVMRKKK